MSPECPPCLWRVPSYQLEHWAGWTRSRAGRQAAGQAADKKSAAAAAAGGRRQKDWQCVWPSRAELGGRITKEQLWPNTGGTLPWRSSPGVWFLSAMTQATL